MNFLDAWLEKNHTGYIYFLISKDSTIAYSTLYFNGYAFETLSILYSSSIFYSQDKYDITHSGQENS